jgi:hypothetical protein
VEIFCDGIEEVFSRAFKSFYHPNRSFWLIQNTTFVRRAQKTLSFPCTPIQGRGAAVLINYLLYHFFTRKHEES